MLDFNVILIDLFFYSDFLGAETTAYRYLSSELTDALIQKKQNNPGMEIQVITDPINVMYGAHTSNHFGQLRSAGITVTITDLRPLRDGNWIYSAWWRTWFQWFGVSDSEGWLPNVMDDKKPKIGLRSYLAAFNYKANHRKVILADHEDQEGVNRLRAFVVSANPHDASSKHSNVGMRFDNNAAFDLLETEFAIFRMMGIDEPLVNTQEYSEHEGDTYVQVLTEKKIKDEVLRRLDGLSEGDSFDMLMFFLSDRDVINAIKEAARRGVQVRVILDPNKDSFGRTKKGIPNRQTGYELESHPSENIQVRWCNTTGEQCHAKLLVFNTDDVVTVIQGSANMTKKNIGDFNLETDVLVETVRASGLAEEVSGYFNQQWSNENESDYSLGYEAYHDPHLGRRLKYYLQEVSGFNRF